MPHRSCSLKGSRLELSHVAIFNYVAYLDRLATDLAVLDEGLAFDRCVQHHRDSLPAVRAGEEVLHQKSVVPSDALDEAPIAFHVETCYKRRTGMQVLASR